MRWYHWLIIIVIILLILYLFYKLFFTSKGLKPNEANRLLREGHFDYIIDVRTDEEWNRGHYQPKRPDLSLLHIGMEKLVTDLPLKVTDKESNILFQCKKGIRSKAANSIAESLGYNNTKYLIGNYTDLN